MKLTLYTLLIFAANLLTAQTATKEQIISDLPEIEITEGINLHIISPEPIQYVDLSTEKLTGDLPNTNIARIKITDHPDSDEKGRRATIDLTPAAAQEVDRLREITGLTTSDLFRTAFSLFRLYVQAREQGNALCIVDPEDENAIRTRLELPIVIPKLSRANSAAKVSAPSKGAKS